MELLLLGTAAADGWPAAYCECPTCTYAREHGGKDLRMRSGALIDDDLKIDHSPDTVVHMYRTKKSLAKVRTLIFTHDHPDHIFPIELKRTQNLARDLPPQPMIAVYGNQRIVNMIHNAFKDPTAMRLDVKPVIKPFEPFSPDPQTTILPVPATHCEEALLFRITRNGRSMFYGHDSGIYKPETLEALGKAGPLDLALLDCTHTTRTDGLEFKHHLGIPTMLRMIEELRTRGAITPKTKLIATHFSPHSGAKTHAEIESHLAPHNIITAYDGLTITV